MMTNERSTKIVYFITPGAGVLVLGRGHIINIVNVHYFFQNLFLYPDIDQTNQVYITDDQGRVYQNCKFHDP